MRDPQGKIKRWHNLDEDERLRMTPFPCGKCLPCKINRRRIWTFRNTLEDMYTPFSYFVTLTYNDERIPITDGKYTLESSHLQSFFKRLRRNATFSKFRYFAVGEYGDSGDRGFNPHYHILLYSQYPISEAEIEKAWTLRKVPYGFIKVGTVEKGSIAYVVGYVIKKLTRPGDPRLDGRRPEFMLSSRKKGGIGAPAIRKIGKELKRNPYYSPSDVMQSLSIAGKNYPLGGYLTKVLAQELGTPESEFKRKLFDYQTELLLEYYDHSGGYYTNIVIDHDQNRLNQETKYKIFGSRRKL